MCQVADTTAVAGNHFIKEGRQQTNPKSAINVKDMQKVKRFTNRISKAKSNS